MLNKIRYISCQVLLDDKGKVKAKRFYSIPQPAAVSKYFDCEMRSFDGRWYPVKVGVLFQDWKTHGIMDDLPEYGDFWDVLKKHFGLFEPLPF